MIVKSNQEIAFVKMVANRLAGEFIEPLFDLSKEKSFCTYMGGLVEILDWSQDFYNHYFNKLGQWETFQSSPDNIYEAQNLDTLITAFGRDRMQKFYRHNADRENYFLDKYATI